MIKKNVKDTEKSGLHDAVVLNASDHVLSNICQSLVAAGALHSEVGAKAASIRHINR